MGAPQTWLPISDAARVAGISAKALRRRIERGTVVSELRADGRRHVAVESINGHYAPGAPVPLPRRGLAEGQVEGQLLERLEELAAENGRLRALTAIAESTEHRLTDELHAQRARVLELQALEAELAAAGPIRAWRIARRRRVDRT
jgi:hypothetical protein